MEHPITEGSGRLSLAELDAVEHFRKGKRTAILAILFTDIVGSTAATEKLGEEVYRRLRHLHDELFMRVMARDDAGTVVKQIGDSFLCVFAEPSTAVLRAVEFQRILHENREHLAAGGYTLEVRIGIHLGQVAVEKALQPDVFGGQVNRAARIEAAATAGQVLTSRAVYENTVGWLKHDRSVNIGQVAYGRVRLKGIDAPEELFGFYPGELGAPPVPHAVRKRRQGRLALMALAGVLAIGVAGWLYRSTQLAPGSTAVPEVRGPVYVQFEDSLFGAEGGEQAMALKEVVIAQAIATLYPYRVVDEQTLTASLAQKGKLFQRHDINGTRNRDYFRDTLGLGGVLQVARVEHDMDDSVHLSLALILYDKTATSSTKRWVTATPADLPRVVREELHQGYLSTQTWTIQARVLAVQDAQLTFKLDSAAILVKSTPVRFMRGFSGKPGHERLTRWIHDKLGFYRREGGCDGCVNGLVNDSMVWATKGYEALGTGMAQGLAVEGKVLELYDTTGTASWHVTSAYPEKLEPGDLIYLRY